MARTERIFRAYLPCDLARRAEWRYRKGAQANVCRSRVMVRNRSLKAVSNRYVSKGGGECIEHRDVALAIKGILKLASPP